MVPVESIKQRRTRSYVPPHTNSTLTKRFNRDKYLLLMLAPLFAYYLIFKYVPMYGVLIAFQE